MTATVKIENVSIVFGDRPQEALPLMDEGRERGDIQAETGQILGVHNCTINVEEGEILVLMGLSGSGKSTLLRAVNGLNPVVRGSVSVHDGNSMVNVTEADPATLRRLRMHNISMVFQQFGLLPWRTVRENVGLPLEVAGVSNDEANSRIEKQLELVGLADWADRKVGELSGGMQQRVGLARAFVTEAPILLMDEPFSALDPLIRTKLQDELLELQERLRRTLIFVSHDLDEAFKLGNKIAIMEGGRIVQAGTPQDIFRDPKNEYVAEFVQHMNPLGVLRARDLMKPVAGETQDSMPADMLIKDGMERLIGSQKAIAIEENGKVIGQLAKDDLLAGMAGMKRDH